MRREQLVVPEGDGEVAQPSSPQLADQAGSGQKLASQCEDTEGKETLAHVQPEEKEALPEQPAALPSEAGPQERPLVHVAPNLLDITTGRAETLTERRQAQEQRDLDQVVHSMLIVGLVISTGLMLAGVVLEIARHQDLPSVEPDLGDVLTRVFAIRPSGFLALGLLVLLATPMLRVLGSIAAFAYVRDWRFTGITFVVLMVVIASILLGKG